MYLMGRMGVEGLYGSNFMRTRVMRLLQGKTILNQGSPDYEPLSTSQIKVRIVPINQTSIQSVRSLLGWKPKQFNRGNIQPIGAPVRLRAQV
jgi:hypothetical protein